MRRPCCPWRVLALVLVLTAQACGGGSGDGDGQPGGGRGDSGSRGHRPPFRVVLHRPRKPSTSSPPTSLPSILASGQKVCSPNAYILLKPSLVHQRNPFSPTPNFRFRTRCRSFTSYFRFFSTTNMASLCPPTNQTSNITDEEFEQDLRIETMMELVYKKIFPIFLALGILSNLINISVLYNLKNQKKKKQIQAVTTTFDYLITLSITQLMACIGLCFSIVHIDREVLSYGWAFYYAHFDTPIVNALTSASVYIVVGLSIDRFIAVCFPEYYTRVSAPDMAKFRIIMALIVPILLYIPNSFSNIVVCEKNGMGYTYAENNDFDWFIFLLFEELCHRIFPALILIILNVCIIIGFRKISKKREEMFKKPKAETNKVLTSKKDDTSARHNQELFLLFLLISIVIAFLVTTLPAAFLALTDKAGTSFGTFGFEVFRSIANILELLGFSANFLLYFCLMPDVREIIRKKLGLLAPKGHPSLSCTSSNEENTKCTAV